MKPKELQVGAVVQIDPASKSAFAGCFLLAEVTYSWGVQGFVAMPQARGTPPNRAYYRARWEEIEFVGAATWVPPDAFPDATK